MGVCENVCCVAAVLTDRVFLALECWSVLYVCVRGVMDVVFSIYIVTHSAVGARVWDVWVFRHAYGVCLCLVCILWQISLCMPCSLLMLVKDARGDHMEEAHYRASLMTTL